jgi:F0F1-type ATP synthase membrane subunit b/b'
MDDVNMLVNELENTVYNAKKTMFGNGNEILLNRAQILGLISEIKRSMPSEIDEARIIKQKANSILAEAEAQAHNIVKNAESTRDLMLAEDTIIAEATEYANKIKADALDFKDNVEYDVKLKIDNLLSDTELSLSDALTLVRNNRASLRNHMKKD